MVYPSALSGSLPLLLALLLAASPPPSHAQSRPDAVHERSDECDDPARTGDDCDEAGAVLGVVFGFVAYHAFTSTRTHITPITQFYTPRNIALRFDHRFNKRSASSLYAGIGYTRVGADYALEYGQDLINPDYEHDFSEQSFLNLTLGYELGLSDLSPALGGWAKRVKVDAETSALLGGLPALMFGVQPRFQFPVGTTSSGSTMYNSVGLRVETLTGTVNDQLSVGLVLGWRWR